MGKGSVVQQSSEVLKQKVQRQMQLQKLKTQLRKGTVAARPGGYQPPPGVGFR